LAVVDTFASVAQILSVYGTVDTRFHILAFGPGNERPQGVAHINPSGSLVLLARNGYPTRNVGRNEDPGDVAREIMVRCGLLPAKAA
jgi:hypothetical protein